MLVTFDRKHRIFVIVAVKYQRQLTPGKLAQGDTCIAPPLEPQSFRQQAFAHSIATIAYILRPIQVPGLPPFDSNHANESIRDHKV